MIINTGLQAGAEAFVVQNRFNGFTPP
jgi:hypothetical protein